MALLKQIESKSGHTNSYWNIAKFHLVLSKREIHVTLYGYKNKWGREYRGWDDIIEYTFPVDPLHKDLSDYEELVLLYSNESQTVLNTNFKLKVDWKANVVPNVNRLVKNILVDMYAATKQMPDFSGAKDI